MAWENYIEDGLQYHAYVPGNHTQHINRLGVNFYLGHQIPSRSAFLCDIFWGLAYRHSFSDKDKPSFNRTMLSYGHTGFVFLTGVRLGFGIK
jgi:predicted membrane-bound dolichyl-phosphate-mannose-protein mannosyltransferase